MKKLYYNKPYVKSFEAVVIACVPGKNGLYEVSLNQTGFYPEGGGQPSDTGMLGDVRVVRVYDKDGVVIHDTDGALEIGGCILGIIDWDRRYMNMQQHSGEHLLSGLIHSLYGYDNVGFHMGTEEVTVDFNGLITAEQANALEMRANELIYENLPVTESFPAREELNMLKYRSKKELTGQVRIIEIPGADICACCGTHVMRTGEIGMIKITSIMNYKGGVRISMLCGKKALEDYSFRSEQVSKISRLLSAKPDHIVEAVDKLKHDNSEKGFELHKLYGQLLSMKAEGYQACDKPLAVFEEDMAPVQLRQFCTVLYETGKGNIVLVCSGRDGSYQYALGSKIADMRVLSKSMNETLHGKGGGSSLLVQGTFQAVKQEILDAFLEGAK